MANNPNPDRNVKYMKETWGTDRLITDYGSLNFKKRIDPLLKDNKNDYK